MSATPAATSLVIAGAATDEDSGDNLTYGTGWTADNALFYDTWLAHEHQSKIGATAVQYDLIYCSFSYAVAGIEIKANPLFYIRPDADAAAGNWTSNSSIAPTVTYKAEAYSDYGGTQLNPLVTGSFTPADNSMLVAVHIGQFNSDSEADISARMSVSGGGLTWTRRVYRNNTDTNYDTCITIFTAPVTTGASMTVTGTINTTTPTSRTWDKHLLQVFEVIGAGGFGATAADSGNDTGPKSITLSAAPAASSLVIAAVCSDDSAGAATPASGWTELRDVNGGTGMALQTQYRSGSTSQTVGWDIVDALYAWEGVALEITAANDLYAALDETSANDADYIEVQPSATTPPTITNLYNYKGTLSGTPAAFTSGSVSYGANKLLVAVVGVSDANTNTTVGTTLTGGGLTWTKRLSRDAIGTNYDCCVEVWTAETTSSGSGALTWTRASGAPAASDNGWVLSVSEISNYGPSWLGTSKIEGAAVQTGYTMTLPATPGAGSLVVAGRFTEVAGVGNILATPGSGWTELHDEPPGHVDWTPLQVMYRLSPGTADVVWDDLDTINNSRTDNTVVFGIEIVPAIPSANICKIRLSDPSVTPAEPMTLVYRAQKTVDVGTMTLRVRLLQGTTQIASWTESNVPLAVTEYTHTLSSGEFAAITDFDDLYLEMGASYTL
jgi:hypothetical protein